MSSIVHADTITTMKLRRWAPLLLAACVGLLGHRAEAVSVAPLLDLGGQAIEAVASDRIELAVVVDSGTHTRVFCIVKSPLGLAAYFFGGTGNGLDVGQRSSVEILFEAWDQAAHGNPYYVPGVMSGRTPEGDRTKRKWYYLWLSRGQISEGAAGRTLGSRADTMIEYLENELAGGDTEVNLFGFSRGSTTALEFLNKIQANRTDPQKKALYAGIKLNFVALWDTVDTTAASYRTELPKGMKFEHKPLHFIALDEQRAQFFNNNVLNIEGALQIGYRGVHADVGGFVYPKKANSFGDFSRDNAVMAAGMIGIDFHQPTLDAVRNLVNWKAIPTENSSIIYNDNETRAFPSDMYLHWSVRSFGKHSAPYNAVGKRKSIGWREWDSWAGKYVP